MARPAAGPDHEVVMREIVDAAYHIHVEIGPGLLESVYESFLAAELLRRRFRVRRQVAVAAEHRGVRVDVAFRADLIVNDEVVVEVKAVEKLAPIHTRQLLTYLRLLRLRHGLLINFNEAVIKAGIARVVNGY